MLNNYIGLNIKKLRMQGRITQQRLADLCGISKGMISKIECGKVMPAVATLSRIAHALGVKVALLMDEGSGHDVICQSTELSMENFALTEVGYRFCTLAAEFGDKLMQPMVFYAKNGEVASHIVSHQGEESIYIIEGSMCFVVNGAHFHMKQGDFLYFNAVLPHGIESVEDEVRYLNLFSDSEYPANNFKAASQ